MLTRTALQDRLILAITSLVLLALVSFSASAGDIIVEDAESNIVNDILVLDINAQFIFAEDAIDAVENGIAVTFDLYIRLQRPRKFTWDPEIYSTQRRFTLERHALSDQYIVTETITGERSYFSSLEQAADQLGRIAGLPVTEASSIADHERVKARIKIKLDIEALPAPMIPLAYLSPDWHMSSGWFEWQIKN